MSSREVDNATGEAPAKVDVIELLAEKRAALDAARKRHKLAKAFRDEQAMSDESRLIDALRELIPELERDASVVLEATGRKEATERLTGISRAAGSVRSELEEDNKRLLVLEKEIGEVNAKRTARARKYEKLQAEADALAARFDFHH